MLVYSGKDDKQPIYGLNPAGIRLEPAKSAMVPAPWGGWISQRMLDEFYAYEAADPFSRSLNAVEESDGR